MKHFINGIEITPRNIDTIGVVSDFTGNPDQLSLNTDTIILPREGNEIIKNHILTKGLFVGLEYQVQMKSGIILEYYVDLCDPSAKPIIRQHECEVKIKKRKGHDDFFDRASGTSFDLIVKKNGIAYFDIKRIPYFVIKDNVEEQALTLGVTIYIMVKETIEAAILVAEAVRDLALATTIGGIIAASIMVVARIAYFIALSIAVTQLAEQLFLILVPVKRYFKGIYFKELFAKSCNFLGYNFSSTLFDNDPGWFLLPVPLIKNSSQSIFESLLTNLQGNFNNGIPTSSDTTGLFGDFISQLEGMFNAQTFIIDNVVHFERRDWLQNSATTMIQPSLSLQGTRDDAFTFNIEDTWKRYYIHYQVDYTDLHTCEGISYDIHDAEFSTENTVPVTSSDLVTIKGLNEVSINFAVGANKDKLNFLEIYVKTALTIIDFITDLATVGNGTNFAQQIIDRKDALKISQQYFSISKALYVKSIGGDKVILDTDKFDTNYSAIALWNRYHYINQISLNNYIIKENVRIRIKESDFVTLLNNNFVLINGVSAEIIKLEWTDEKHDALITYKEINNWSVGKVNTLTINS